MKITWNWNILETISVIMLFVMIAYLLFKIIGTIWLNGKFKGWW